MDGGEKKSKVHIRTQQRNGRKSITTVQGLDEDLDLKKICKAFKKVRAAAAQCVAVQGGSATLWIRPCQGRLCHVVVC